MRSIQPCFFFSCFCSTNFSPDQNFKYLMRVIAGGFGQTIFEISRFSQYFRLSSYEETDWSSGVDLSFFFLSAAWSPDGTNRPRLNATEVAITVRITLRTVELL